MTKHNRLSERPVARLERLMERVEFDPRYRFEARPDGPRAKLYVFYATTDSSKPGDEGRAPKIAGEGQQYEVIFDLPMVDGQTYQTDDEIYERVLKLLVLIQRHEVQEQFRVNGKIFRDPHLVGLISSDPLVQGKTK